MAFDTYVFDNVISYPGNPGLGLEPLDIPAKAVLDLILQSDGTGVPLQKAFLWRASLNKSQSIDMDQADAEQLTKAITSFDFERSLAPGLGRLGALIRWELLSVLRKPAE